MAYGDIKISELTAVTASADSDILPVVQSGSTKKASIAQIKIPVLASPAMTGTPTAPTPAVGDDSTRVATTEFVNDEINNDRPYSSSDPLINGIAAQGTSDAISREDHVHPSDTSKADLDSPALTGIPTAPTASVTTDTTQIATTEFVNDEIAHNTRYLTDFRVWTSGRAYAINDPVFYEGVPYRSLQADNTNNQPDISPTYWEVTGGGSDASNPGVTFENGQFESSSTGWTTYDDGAVTTPVDGTGGTPSYFTFARTATTPLIGTGSGLITKSAANAIGEGVSYDFTIDRGIVYEEMKIEFQYEASANYANGDIGVFLYDKTNAVLIPISVQDIPASYGKPGTFLATFIPSTSTSYRLIFHTTTSTTTSWTMMIDNVVVGNKDIAVGAAISEWQIYTPTLSGGSYNAGASIIKWRRVGSNMEIMGRLVLSAAATGTLTVSLPEGYEVHGDFGINYTTLGSCTAVEVGGSLYSGTLKRSGATTLSFHGPSSTTSWNATIPFTWASGDYLSFLASFPIAQWTSNVNLASDFQEFAYNSDSSSSANTDSFGYGPEGGLVPNITTSTTGLGISKRVSFRKPIQPTDILMLEIYDAAVGRWAQASERNGGFIQQGSYNFGARISAYGESTVDITFGSGGYRPSAATYASVGTQYWSALYTAGWRWRVRKVSNGNMAEVPPLVRAEYYNCAAATASANLIYQTKVLDTHSAYNSSTGEYICPIAGIYQIDADWLGSAPGNILIQKNGGMRRAIQTPSGSRAFGVVTISCEAGDVLRLRTEAGTVAANIGTYLNITRIGS